MIRQNDLIACFQQALDEKWGYILGTAGQTWTAQDQAATDNDMAKKYGSRWVGKKVADCSGLFAWAFKRLGGSIYHGSNTIWKSYLTDKGTLTSSTKLIPGMAVFKVRNGNDRYHIGLHIGEGRVIEAKGTPYGVVESRVSEWHEWGLLKGVSYSGIEPAASRQTLRKGDIGEDVTDAQKLLLQRGYSLGDYGADGKFGSATETAVRQFQAACKIQQDGIIGPDTWRYLEEDMPKILTDREKLDLLWIWYQEEHGVIQNG